MLTSMGLPARRGGQRHPVLPRARPPPTTTSTRPWPSCRVRSPSCETEPVRVLVAMSGGVDSSVAAALLADRLGRDRVVGATLKLWGGASDSGCCSVADVDDARRVADQLGPRPPRLQLRRRRSRSGWSTPTSGAMPKAGRPTRASSATATSSSTGCWSGPPTSASTPWPPATTPDGPRRPDGRFRLCRGADPDKDQSYVLAMLGQDQLARTLFPVGEMTKAEVRAEARRPRTAHRGQARQPGRLLHPLGRGPLGVPRCPAPAAPGPAGRPPDRRGPRRRSTPWSW